LEELVCLFSFFLFLFNQAVLEAGAAAATAKEGNRTYNNF